MPFWNFFSFFLTYVLAIDKSATGGNEKPILKQRAPDIHVDGGFDRVSIGQNSCLRRDMIVMLNDEKTNLTHLICDECVLGRDRYNLYLCPSGSERPKTEQNHVLNSHLDARGHKEYICG